MGTPHPPFTENYNFFLTFFSKKKCLGLEWSICCETDSVWYGKFIWSFFTPSLRWARLLSILVGCQGWGLGGVIFMSLVFFHVSEHSEHICFFLVGIELNIFPDEGYPRPLNLWKIPQKIIDLIFQPFPYTAHLNDSKLSESIQHTSRSPSHTLWCCQTQLAEI